MAILIQYLSAKLGIATGATLPQNCREHFSRRTAILLWVAAELSALATDLAEFLGAALGFYLLFGGYFLHLGLARTTVMFIAAVVSAVCVSGTTTGAGEAALRAASVACASAGEPNTTSAPELFASSVNPWVAE